MMLRRSTRGIALIGTWLTGRSPRERALTGLAATVLLSAAYAMGVWRPLTEARSAALDRLSRTEALIDTMKNDGTRLRALAAAAPAVAAMPAATAITQEAAARQIAIQRLERDGNHLRVTVDNVDFATLITWLSRLEAAHGLRLTALDVDRRPDPGVVAARITLEE